MMNITKHFWNDNISTRIAIVELESLLPMILIHLAAAVWPNVNWNRLSRMRNIVLTT